jgi:hypothetical protein
LQAIVERAEMVKGKALFLAAAPHGTVVLVEVPLQRGEMYAKGSGSR